MKFYYVYVLRSLSGNFKYVGFTSDLIHYEAYGNQKDAKRREEYLKTTKGKTTLKTMLKVFFN